MLVKVEKNYYFDTILTRKTDQGTIWIVQIKEKKKPERSQET